MFEKTPYNYFVGLRGTVYDDRDGIRGSKFERCKEFFTLDLARRYARWLCKRVHDDYDYDVEIYDKAGKKIPIEELRPALEWVYDVTAEMPF